METENNYEEERPEPPSCDWCGSDRNTLDSNEEDARITVYHFDRGEEFICSTCDNRYHMTCTHCGNAMNYDCDTISYDSTHGNAYCNYCADDYLFWCGDCDEYHENDDGCPNGYSHDSVIRPYQKTHGHTFCISPGRTSSREPHKTVVTGVELEINTRDGYDKYELAELTNQIFEPYFCELKDDASVQGGFEIVTQPMTLEYLREEFPYKKLSTVAENGGESAQCDDCGLHVHINRGFFDNRYSTMYRFMSMIHRNNEMWKIIAGRDSVYHCRWENDEHKKAIEYVKYAHSKGIKGIRENENRYVPINLMNRHTIELRFFKGALEPNIFIARVESVHALANYSVFTSNKINIKKMYDWQAFRVWAEDNGYCNFSSYATQKGV